MKSTDLDQMCDHLIVHPNVSINELKQHLEGQLQCKIFIT